MMQRIGKTDSMEVPHPTSISNGSDEEVAVFPVSFAQQRLWFIDALVPEPSLYNVSCSFELNGSLDVGALEKAFAELVRRHESLRTTFSAIDGRPVQVISTSAAFTLSRADLSTESESSRQDRLASLSRDFSEHRFSLESGPLLKTVLVRLSPRSHILMITLHHIITDGWSMSIFFAELSALYEAYCEGRESPLDPVEVQYSDYAVWERNQQDSPRLEAQFTYWKEKLRSLPRTEIVPDAPRPSISTNNGTHVPLSVPEDVTRDLKALARETNSTLFQVLFATVNVLLAKHASTEDVAIGTVVAGRPVLAVESVIGFFVNTLTVRTDLSGDPTFADVISRTRNEILSALDNQDVPFDRLVAELLSDRDVSRNPLFQTLFVFQNTPSNPLVLKDLDVKPYPLNSTTAKFDILLSMKESSRGLKGSVGYNTDLYEPATIDRLITHFIALLRCVSSDPDATISSYDFLSSEEHQLFKEWNETASPFPQDVSIDELCSRQASETPDAIAVSSGGISVTYRQLDERANLLAGLLQSKRVVSGSTIVICLDRSIESIIVILAVLRAGGIYVPVDPEYPRERLRLILEDVEPVVVITQSRYEDLFPDNRKGVILIDRIEYETAELTRPNSEVVSSADHIAYIMYTSGSTGIPKGVAVSHKNVVRLVRDTNYVQIEATDKLLGFAPLSFDASTFEIWGSLLNGAELVLARPGRLSLSELGATISGSAVSVAWLTAGLFNVLIDEFPSAFDTLRCVLAGGDVLSPVHVAKLRELHPSCTIVNGYGPTECTTFSCCFVMDSDTPQHGPIPIGKPVSNTRVYVVDEQRKRVPIGVVGELLIGGEGVAQGYWKRPQLNSASFISNPFDKNDPNPVYVSGDLVRFRNDGLLEFFGRKDNQVKIRGFRIEPGEIEFALLSNNEILSCVVEILELPEKTIVAYFVAVDGSNLTQRGVRDYLEERLPSYMIPTFFEQLEVFPLTPNGKIDRRALPIPARRTDALKLTGSLSEPEPEKTESEERIEDIWKELLALDRIGVDENFFELGGHSILAAQLMARLQKLHNRTDLTPAILFSAPTIRKLAAVLEHQLDKESWDWLVPIQPYGSRTPLFLIHGVSSGVLHYKALIEAMDPDQPIYGIHGQGQDGRRISHASVEEMSAAYTDEILRVSSEGPFQLVSFCAGGFVALEIAQQLKTRGKAVSMLAYIDVTAPAHRQSDNMTRVVSRARSMRTGGLQSALSWGLRHSRYRMHRIRRRTRTAVVDVLTRFDVQIPTVWRTEYVEETYTRIMMSYRPQLFDGDVLLFRSEDTARHGSDLGWSLLNAGHIHVFDLPGKHLTILKSPESVSELANRLESYLLK